MHIYEAGLLDDSFHSLSSYKFITYETTFLIMSYSTLWPNLPER